MPFQKLYCLSLDNIFPKKFMQRNIQQITQRFVDRLPDDDQYYRPDELRSWGFPPFLVNRIKIELERNLEESLNIPKSDWANTQSDPVQRAWERFVDAIRAEARLPASYGKAVIETAVADILEMLVQPRKNVPEVIFGNDTYLSYSEIRERLKSVVVYRHFAKLILRYMEKKERDELSKERCRQVVANADEKLTVQYSPLNWAQMLEPLFKLVGGEIDTNLLRLFFEDRNKPRVARKFDLMNKSLTRAELIEILSSPDLLDFEGYEDDQSNLFEDQPADDSSSVNTKQSEDTESSGTISPRGNTGSSQKQKERQVAPGESEESNKESSGENIEGEKPEVESEEEEQEKTWNSFFTEEEESEEDYSLNARFKEESAEDDSESKSIPQKQSEENKKLTDQKAVERDTPPKPADHEEGRASVRSDQTAASEETQLQDKAQNSASEEDEDTPIWMRYMSEEEIAEYEQQQQQEEEEEIEDGFIDDPIIDLTEEDASEEEIEALQDQLSGERELFVEKIFRGSDRAFDEAVEEIATYDSWRQASKYIEKNIFKRNLVDMYSDAAVSFTDQLQSYFISKQNQN